MTAAGFSLALLCLFGTIFIIGILGSIFWIWMLIDCLTKEPDEGNSKLAWALTILFLHFIGASIYYFVRRPERLSMYGR
jgi:Phospholipase_D-nuclease N-terminal